MVVFTVFTFIFIFTKHTKIDKSESNIGSLCNQVNWVIYLNLTESLSQLKGFFFCTNAHLVLQKKSIRAVWTCQVHNEAEAKYWKAGNQAWADTYRHRNVQICWIISTVSNEVLLRDSQSCLTSTTADVVTRSALLCITFFHTNK